MRLLLIFTLLPLLSIAGTKSYDRKDKLKGVSLQTGKDDDLRNYRGFSKKVFPYPAELMLKGFTNFTDRCNNQLSDERKFTASTHQCRYHNENIIESFVLTDLKPGWLPDHGEVARYVVGRRIYNRGVYGYYDLVQIIRGKNKEGQITHVVSTHMLSDKEAKNFINVKLKQESSFEKADTQYILTEISPNETEVKYIYEAATRHWVLNKEFSVGQVFSSISSSVNNLFTTAALEADRLNKARTVASEEQ